MHPVPCMNCENHLKHSTMIDCYFLRILVSIESMVYLFFIISVSHLFNHSIIYLPYPSSYALSIFLLHLFMSLLSLNLTYHLSIDPIIYLSLIYSTIHPLCWLIHHLPDLFTLYSSVFSIIYELLVSIKYVSLIPGFHIFICVF